jgi:hypothetical protein
MGSISWLREVPKDALHIDDDTHEALILEKVWHQIDTYDFSEPTSPSPGRVYRHSIKNILSIVVPDPAKHYQVLTGANVRYRTIHYHYKAVIV